MRIAYLVHWAEQPNGGVIRKIRSQTSSWTAKGHDVVVFLVIPSDNESKIRVEFENRTPVRTFPYGSKTSRALKLGRAAREIVQWKPDVTYCRQTIYHPALSYLGARVSLVIEVNSNDLRELEFGSRLRKWYGLLTRSISYSPCAGLVCVTHELANAPEFLMFDKPTTVIANGIDLSASPRLPPTEGSTPSLVFIGSAGQSWHGIDKILSLARLRPDWRFTLVGLGASDLGDSPPDNVLCRGHLDAEGCRTAMAQSDVAIGTLALHRKAMSEACPLKVREYLRAGLPTIIAYDDTDFETDVPFILKLPNIEDNLDIEKIEKFVLKWMRKRLDRDQILHLDVSAKEDSRLKFLKQCAS